MCESVCVLYLRVCSFIKLIMHARNSLYVRESKESGINVFTLLLTIYLNYS